MSLLNNVVNAFLERTADAKTILFNYLRTGIDEKLLKSVNIGNIIGGLFKRAPKGIDYDIMAEDVVEEFIKQEALKDLIPDLEVAISRDHKIDMDTAEKIVDPRSKIPEDVNITEIQQTAKKLIGKFLDVALSRRMQHWLRTHEDESLKELVEKGVDVKNLPTIKQDWEEIEDQAEEEGWEKDLIKKSRDVIRFKAKNPKLEKFFLKVFDDIIIAEKPKTLMELAKEFEVGKTTVDEAKIKILTWLKESPILKEQIEKGKKHYQYRKEDIPDYTEYLDDEDKSDSLKEYLKRETRGKKSETAEKIINLLAEGKTTSEIAKIPEFKDINTKMIKKRFLEKYNQWYLQTQKNKCARLIFSLYQERYYDFPKKIREIAMILSKTVKVPHEKPGTDEPVSGEKEKGIIPELFNTFEKKIEQKISKRPSPFNVEVYFKADFDNFTKTSEDKDPNFKYEEYRANFKVKDLQIGNRLWNLNYTYTQPLNSDGSFKGSGDTDIVMYAENKKTGEKEKYDPDEMKTLLTNHVKKELLPQGINPHGGISVIYYNTNPKIPARQREIPGVEQLRKRFEGIADWAGPVHKERIRKQEEKEETLRLRKLGPRPLELGEEKENRRMISQLRRELKEEKMKGLKADKKRIQDLMKEISYLEDLVSKAQSARERIEEMTKKEKEELKSMLEEEKRRMKLSHYDFIAHLKDIASRLVISQALPGPQILETKKLFEMAQDYKISKPNVRLWMNSDDIRVLGAALRAEIQKEMKERTDNIKKGIVKVDSKKEAIQEAQEEAKRKLAQAMRWIEKIPEDLEKRRDLMKKQNPDAYEKYFRSGTGRDPDWIDDKDKVSSTISKTKDVMEKGLELERPKEKAYQLIDIGEFETLENFAKEVQAGVLPLARRFEKASINKVGTDEERLKSLKEEHDKLESYQQDLKKILKDLEAKMEGPDSQKIKRDLENIRNDMEKAFKQSDELAKTIKRLENVPAYGAAGALLAHLNYFSELYNSLSSYLWFRQEHVVRGSYDVLSKEVTINDLQKWQEKISEGAKKLSGITPLRSKDSEQAIKNILRDIRPKLKDFRYQLIKSPELYEPSEEEREKPEKKERKFPELPPRLQEIFKERGKVEIPILPKLRRELNEELIKPEAEQDKQKIKKIEEDIEKVVEQAKKQRRAAIPYNKIGADDKPSREEMIKKSVFPESELAEAKRIIEKIGEKRSVDLKDQAQEHLNNLTDGITKLYSQGMPIDVVKEVAEAKKISPDEARLFIKDAMERMARAGMREFMDRWRDVLDPAWKTKERVKEKTPLGNKPPDQYKAMWDYVEHHIPKIDEAKEPEVTVEEPAMAIPTSKQIMESVKRFFKQKDLDESEAAKIFRAELAEAEGRAEGGASKGKGKTRPKVIKPPPPQGTWQELKKEFANIMKENKNGFGVVQDVLLPYVLRTKKSVQEAVKNNEAVDADSIIDGLVYLAKQIKNFVRNLQVGPSEAAFKKLKIEGPGAFPSGGRRLVSRPDITVDNLKEAEELFEKIQEIYKWINHYIAPDKVGVPPESLERIRKAPQEFWPRNFGALIDEFQKAEGKKTSSELFWEEKKSALGINSSWMSYKVVEKFSSLQNQDESAEEQILSTDEVFDIILN